MARPPRREIRMRLVVEQPVRGETCSRQDRQGRPVDAKGASGASPTSRSARTPACATLPVPGWTLE